MKTDHSADITKLRDQAQFSSVTLVSRAAECAAALLEVHDATGISLDNWFGPRELVELMIGHPITENGV